MSPLVESLAIVIALVGHGMLWFGVVNRVHSWAGPRPIVDGITLASFLSALSLPLAAAWELWPGSLALFEPFAPPTAWAGWYAWLCLAIGTATFALKPLLESRRYDPRVQRAHTSETTDLSAELGARTFTDLKTELCGLVPGNEVLTLSVDLRQLEIPRLPQELERLTIAHISDLHMTGRVGLSYFEKVIAHVDALRPDVVAITGDIVESEDCWSWLAPTLGRLTAPLGVYFILGNHDKFIDAAQTRRILVEAGLVCLSGRALRTEWNGVSVLLAGNECPWIPPAPDLTPFPPRGETPQFRLALVHTPDQFGWGRRADFDLMLAGHTHGGQVQAPLLGPIASPSRYGSRYACGVFRRGSTVLHVTRGVGSKTPLRLRCPPEIALLELTGQRPAVATPEATDPRQSAPSR